MHPYTYAVINDNWQGIRVPEWLRATARDGATLIGAVPAILLSFPYMKWPLLVEHTGKVYMYEDRHRDRYTYSLSR
jgi:hypothetical protein